MWRSRQGSASKAVSAWHLKSSSASRPANGGVETVPPKGPSSEEHTLGFRDGFVTVPTFFRHCRSLDLEVDRSQRTKLYAISNKYRPYRTQCCVASLPRRVLLHWH